MSGRWTPQFVPAPCPRCTGLGDAHYLTCPTLRLQVSPARDRAFREMVALSEELGLYDDDQAEQDSMSAEPDWRGAFDMAPGHGGW